MADLLTAQEAAELLKLKKSTVYEMVKRGELPAVRLGKQLRFSRSELEKLVTASVGQAVPMTLPTGAPTSSLVLCGQDTCLDIIASRVSALPGALPILRSHAGSYNSLTQLYAGQVDIATAHLWHERSGSYNLPYIEALLPGLEATVVRLLGRTAGFYVQKGNPKNITGFGDLARQDITFVNRERGCGIRVLLDEKRRAMGLDAANIRGYATEQGSHLLVAGAVGRGEADYGLGAEAAALQIPEVDFIPLQQEWYDLVFPTRRESELSFRLLLDYITGPELRAELNQLGRYDLSQTGKVFHV